MMLIRYLSQIGRYFIMLKDVFNRPVKWSVMKQLILKEIEGQEIASIGFRIVHGGEKYTKTTKLTKSVISELEELNELESI